MSSTTKLKLNLFILLLLVDISYQTQTDRHTSFIVDSSFATNEANEYAVSIHIADDFTFFGVTQLINSEPTITLLKDETGTQKIPTMISFLENDLVLIGNNAKMLWDNDQNIPNTIYFLMQLIGRTFDDSLIQLYMHLLCFDIISDDNGNMKINIYRSIQDHVVAYTYSAEEILSIYLKHIIFYAEEFLIPSKINKVALTVPTYFKHSQRKALEYAVSLAGLTLIKAITINHAISHYFNYSEAKSTSSYYSLVLYFDYFSIQLQLVDNYFGEKIFPALSDFSEGGIDLANTIFNLVKEDIKNTYNGFVVDDDFYLRKKLVEECNRILPLLLSSDDTQIIEISFELTKSNPYIQAIIDHQDDMLNNPSSGFSWLNSFQKQRLTDEMDPIYTFQLPKLYFKILIETYLANVVNKFNHYKKMRTFEFETNSESILYAEKEGLQLIAAFNLPYGDSIFSQIFEDIFKSNSNPYSSLDNTWDTKKILGNDVLQFSFNGLSLITSQLNIYKQVYEQTNYRIDYFNYIVGKNYYLDFSVDNYPSITKTKILDGSYLKFPEVTFKITEIDSNEFISYPTIAKFKIYTETSEKTEFFSVIQTEILAEYTLSNIQKGNLHLLSIILTISFGANEAIQVSFIESSGNCLGCVFSCTAALCLSKEGPSSQLELSFSNIRYGPYLQRQFTDPNAFTYKQLTVIEADTMTTDEVQNLDKAVALSLNC